MTQILSLIAGESAELTPRQIDLVNHALMRGGTESGDITWLQDGRACDLSFAGDALKALQSVREALSTFAIDANVVAPQNRRKKLFISDMDSTAIVGETLDDLSTYTPFKAEIDALTAKSVMGTMSFIETLIARVDLMRGLHLDAFARADACIEVSAGMPTVVATMRKQGAITALVSGGFRYFTSRVRDRIGFDLDVSNDLEIANDCLTGKLIPPLIDPGAKVATLQRLAEKNGFGVEDCLAAGDGSNDIPMLEAAGLGVAYRGKPKVRAAIRCQLNHSDLRGLLFLQGIHRDEFVEIPDKQ